MKLKLIDALNAFWDEAPHTDLPFNKVIKNIIGEGNLPIKYHKIFIKKCKLIQKLTFKINKIQDKADQDIYKLDKDASKSHERIKWQKIGQ